MDYQAKWDRQDGSAVFLFSDPYDIESSSADAITLKVPTAQVPGDGEYQDDGYVEPRVLSVSGVLSATDPDAFRARWDALNAALVSRREGRLYLNSDRFIACRFVGLAFDGKDDGITVRNWTASFRSGKPFFQSATLSTLGIATAGTTGITIGGNWPAPLTLTVIVSSIGAGGTVTVAATNDGLVTTFVLSPSDTGTYVIDAARGTVRLDGDDAITDFSGAFLREMAVSGAGVTVTLAGGATLTSITASWRSYWTTS